MLTTDPNDHALREVLTISHPKLVDREEWPEQKIANKRITERENKWKNQNMLVDMASHCEKSKR